MGKDTLERGNTEISTMKRTNGLTDISDSLKELYEININIDEFTMDRTGNNREVYSKNNGDVTEYIIRYKNLIDYYQYNLTNLVRHLNNHKN